MTSDAYQPLLCKTIFIQYLPNISNSSGEPLTASVSTQDLSSQPDYLVLCDALTHHQLIMCSSMLDKTGAH